MNTRRCKNTYIERERERNVAGVREWKRRSDESSMERETVTRCAKIKYCLAVPVYINIYIERESAWIDFFLFSHERRFFFLLVGDGDIPELARVDRIESLTFGKFFDEFILLSIIMAR